MDRNITIKVQWHITSPDGSTTNTTAFMFLKMCVVKTLKNTRSWFCRLQQYGYYVNARYILQEVKADSFSRFSLRTL